MNCQRCSGFMVQDRAYDLLDTNIHCDVWRCVSCGNMLDNLILRNQENFDLKNHSLRENRHPQEITAA